MEHYIQNLRDGDLTTALMVIAIAVVIFLVLKFMTSIFKAILIMVVIVVAIAVIYPESHIVDKVEEGSHVAIEKGKVWSQKLQDATGEHIVPSQK